MPDDLLPHVIGPTPLSSGWVWLVALLAVAVIAWYAAVFVLTRPGAPQLVARVHDALVRRRFAGAVRRIRDRFRAGELGDAPAGAALSQALRDFLHQATGVRAQYMQLNELADGELARAAPLLARINDVQFNARSDESVEGLSSAAEELILSWT